jgi:hypothetical protein
VPSTVGFDENNGLENFPFTNLKTRQSGAGRRENSAILPAIQYTDNSPVLVAMLKRLAALVLLLLASAWAALINGHPFFYPDTTNYVRGPDFAVVHFLGKNYATSWTQDVTRQKAEDSSRDAIAGSSADSKNTPNSPADKAVMAGRSIYYGALLYAGHLTSYFWLTVFTQALIFLYLSYTFVVTCLRLSFLTFVCSTLIILVTTPLSFYISFLMPDVFASFLILATIVLAVFWDALKLRDRIFVSAIILYSALAATSHLLLLGCLGLLFLCLSFVTEHKSILSSSIPKRAFVLFTLILAGVFGELAFSYGVRQTLGVDPIRPPFLMARIIADGPGYKFLLKNCTTKPYVICDYIDRLRNTSTDNHDRPTTDSFLWSWDPNTGVFIAADSAKRRALVSEQFSFVFDVFRSDPIGLTTTMLRNFIDQLSTVGITEFFPHQGNIQYYKEKLPDYYFNALLRSNIIWHHWVRTAGDVWYSLVYITSMVGLVLVWAFVLFQKKPRIFPRPQWSLILTFAVAGIVFNAVICGVLSEPNPRYQARISWIPLFVLAVMIANLWETNFGRLGSASRLRKSEVGNSTATNQPVLPA